MDEPQQRQPIELSYGQRPNRLSRGVALAGVVSGALFLVFAPMLCITFGSGLLGLGMLIAPTVPLALGIAARAIAAGDEVTVRRAKEAIFLGGVECVGVVALLLLLAWS